VLDRVETLSDLLHVGPELGTRDQRERSGVVQHVRVLVGMQPDVHRHRGHPRLDRRENRLEAIRTVGHEETHSAARPPSQGNQGLCETPNSVGRPPEWHYFPVSDPGRPIGIAFSRARQEMPGIHDEVEAGSLTIHYCRQC